MDTSLYSDDDISIPKSKVKRQILNSVLPQQPIVEEILSRQQKNKSSNQQIEMKKQGDSSEI